MTWETVIGLEIHVQLNTKSKIFSGSDTTFGAEPNTQASLIDLGMPGVLPVLNKGAVRNAIKFGLGINAELCRTSVFARKNYFYPDLPKGYQISQMDLPIVGKGFIDIDLADDKGGERKIKRVNITRAHLEEDAGKSLHEDFSGMTGIDLNRAGTPLLEIVSEPDMRSAKEAVAYAKAIHALIRYLGISDGNMAEGSMRCDCNVSIRQKGEEQFGTRREIKNVNSFKFIEKAINSEVEWQIDEIESGHKIAQATVLYNPDTNKTRAMRSKEEANDYRYFPDPDLLPVVLDETLIEEIRASLPELPDAKRERFVTQYSLPEYDAGVLVADRVLADFFEATTTAADGAAKQASNWIMGDVLGALNRSEKDIAESPISPVQLGGLIKRINDNTISGKIAKQVFQALWDGEGTSADDVIEKKGLKQESDSGAIEALIDEVITANPDNVAAYRGGKDKLFGFFVGEVMKRSKGKANPGQVNDILKKKLG
jgi:aspartyl-tRNA(Asn)/glutamyl-tRNA(Gln) amidotransferase subunit B